MLFRKVVRIFLNPALIGCFAAFSLFFSIFYGYMSVNQYSDHSLHIDYAFKIKSLEDITAPHFLYQIIFIITDKFIEIKYLSASIIMAACYVILYYIIFKFLKLKEYSISQRWDFILIISLLLSSHIFLFTMISPNFYYNYLTPISYHNPTQQLNKVFALSIWLIYCYQFLRPNNDCYPSWQAAAAIAFLLSLSAIAKPSFVVAFLPITGLIALAHLYQRKFRAFFYYSASVFPVFLVLVGQFVFTYTGDDSRGLIFAPFVIFADPTQYIITLPLSLAFPLSCLIVMWRDARQSRSFMLAWAFMIVALFYTLFLAEAREPSAGNFAWTAQTGAFLLYVESFFLMFAHYKKNAHMPVICTAIFAVHVFFGIIFASANMLIPATQWL